MGTSSCVPIGARIASRVSPGEKEWRVISTLDRQDTDRLNQHTIRRTYLWKRHKGLHALRKPKLDCVKAQLQARVLVCSSKNIKDKHFWTTSCKDMDCCWSRLWHFWCFAGPRLSVGRARVPWERGHPAQPWDLSAYLLFLWCYSLDLHPWNRKATHGVVHYYICHTESQL